MCVARWGAHRGDVQHNGPVRNARGARACNAVHSHCSGGVCCCDEGWGGARCATKCDSFACTIGYRELAPDAPVAGSPRLALAHPGYRQQHSAVAVQHDTNATIAYACKTGCPTVATDGLVSYGGAEACLAALQRSAFASIGSAAPLKSTNAHCSSAAACCSGTSASSISFGGVGVDRVTSGSNWDAYGNFGGGVRPDLFVICIGGDTAYCNHPRILGRAVGRRELSSTSTVLLLSALAASFLALH